MAIVFERFLNCVLTLVLDLGKIVKDSIQKQGMLAWQYNTIGVSDAITMGGEGKRLKSFGCTVPTSFTDSDRNAIFPPE